MKWGLMVLAGGVLYSVGAVAYVLKWPNPIPSVYGYHGELSISFEKCMTYIRG